jgi:uncharacterized membrane protein
MTRSPDGSIHCTKMLRIVIIVLSLAGLIISLYFTFAYYSRVKKARWIPEILCARTGSSCVTVVQTPYGRVFGVPNSLLGIVYYVALIIGATKDWSYGINLYMYVTNVVFPFAFGLLIFISAGTVALGFYLIYALRRRLHIDCPLCYVAHAINAALLVLLVLRTHWMSA